MWCCEVRCVHFKMSADWHTSLLHLLEPPVDSIVSKRRQLATVRMATHAVKGLPEGDLVETGVFRVGCFSGRNHGAHGARAAQPVL